MSTNNLVTHSCNDLCWLGRGIILIFPLKHQVSTLKPTEGLQSVSASDYTSVQEPAFKIKCFKQTHLMVLAGTVLEYFSLVDADLTGLSLLGHVAIFVFMTSQFSITQNIVRSFSFE